jgi:putative peptide zinc metalloprotease protein
MSDFQNFDGFDREMRFDTSERGDQYLLIAADGQHIKLAKSAYFLLKRVRAGVSFEAIAEEFSRGGKRRFTATEAEVAYKDLAERLGGFRIDSRVLPGGFWLQVRLLPASCVERVASILAIAYSPVPAALLVAWICVNLGWLLWKTGSAAFDGADLWCGYALFLLSLLGHELGHASACARFGSKPADIGFTFYLIYPAFYSDVTSAWALKRWQRVIVDLGGTFFQFAMGGVFASAYFLCGWEALRAATLMIWYGALFSLNPIFKFDGYWMVADALGVSNLAAQPGRLMRHLLHKVRGSAGERLPWPRWVVLALAIYTPVTFLTWSYFVMRMVPSIFESTINFPTTLAVTVLELRRAGLGAFPWADAASFSATTLLLITAWIGAGRLAIGIAGWGRRAMAGSLR